MDTSDNIKYFGFDAQNIKSWEGAIDNIYVRLWTELDNNVIDEIEALQKLVWCLILRMSVGEINNPGDINYM